MQRRRPGFELAALIVAVSAEPFQLRPARYRSPLRASNSSARYGVDSGDETPTIQSAVRHKALRSQPPHGDEFHVLGTAKPANRDGRCAIGRSRDVRPAHDAIAADGAPFRLPPANTVGRDDTIAENLAR